MNVLDMLRSVPSTIKAVVIFRGDPKQAVVEIANDVIKAITDPSIRQQINEQQFMSDLRQALDQIPDWQLRAVLWQIHDRLRKYWGDGS